jgi:hypothetical protein
MSKGETEMKLDRIYGIFGLTVLAILAVTVGLAVGNLSNLKCE